MEAPKDLSECYSRKEFSAFEKALNWRLDHMASDQHRVRESLQGEMNHKFGTLRQMVIWVGGISFALTGWMWSEHSKVREELAAHSHVAYDIVLERVNSLMCSVYQICGGS